MARAHNPYEDPLVRRRHRRLVWRGTWKWLRRSFLISFCIFEALVLLLSLVLPFAGAGTEGFLYALFIGTIQALIGGAFFAMLFGCIGLVLSHTSVRKSGRAFGPHYCHRCGYRLEGLTEPTCPECGKPLRRVRFKV